MAIDAVSISHLRQRVGMTPEASSTSSPSSPSAAPVDHLRDRVAFSEAYYQAASNQTPQSPQPPQSSPPAESTQAAEQAQQKSAEQASIDRLRNMRPEELAELGANDKQGFFEALRPAAEEAERIYNVPAEITLAQAALETGWGQHTIMSEDGTKGFNLFGMKGEGTAGSVSKSTQEWENGQYITITDKFALYNDFYEAVVEHGKRFHNGYYDKAIEQFPQDHSWQNFAANIQGIYATDPKYSSKLSNLVAQYGIEQSDTAIA